MGCMGRHGATRQRVKKNDVPRSSNRVACLLLLNDTRRVKIMYNNCAKCGATHKNERQQPFVKAGSVWCGHCGALLTKKTKRVL